MNLLNTPASAGGPDYWVLVVAGTMFDTGSRVRGNDANGTGTDAIASFSPSPGAYLDQFPRNVCASFIHELAHAVQVNAGTIDNTTVSIPEAVPDPSDPTGQRWISAPEATVNLSRRELVGVQVENCWRALQGLPLRQRYASQDSETGALTAAILPANVANPTVESCVWPPDV
jgi:hypothetical protein